MGEKIHYSLSYYFDELKKRHKTKGAIGRGIELLKVLKEAKDHTLPLTALARKTNLKIRHCQELCEELQTEGLIKIEPDYEMGNDRISLTDKGLSLF
ncbi:MAG: hypothetical protein D6828_03565 [Nitrospirae bacterium]|nr:MAG: hypothetical protein D6828_03565 [Nitrospirota bacterium]